MTQDPQAPATKEDIQMLLNKITTCFDEIGDRLLSFEGRFERNILESEERIKRHFDVVMKKLYDDFIAI